MTLNVMYEVSFRFIFDSFPITKNIVSTELYHVYNNKLELRHLTWNSNFPKNLRRLLISKTKVSGIHRVKGNHAILESKCML